MEPVRAVRARMPHAAHTRTPSPERSALGGDVSVCVCDDLSATLRVCTSSLAGWPSSHSHAHTPAWETCARMCACDAAPARTLVRAGMLEALVDVCARLTAEVCRAERTGERAYLMLRVLESVCERVDVSTRVRLAHTEVPVTLLTLLLHVTQAGPMPLLAPLLRLASCFASVSSTYRRQLTRLDVAGVVQALHRRPVLSTHAATAANTLVLCLQQWIPSFRALRSSDPTARRRAMGPRDITVASYPMAGAIHR